MSYKKSDELDNVYVFTHSIGHAIEFAMEVNRLGITRKGKFVAGSFEAQTIPGRLPAVVGRLTGNGART